MAYKRMTAGDVPKRSRLSVPRFEKTPEWRLMRADLDRGLKPNEALQVVLTEADKKKYKIRNRRTVARFVQKYITSNNLPYSVTSFHRDDEGDFFIVQYGVPRAAGQSLSNSGQTLPERGPEGRS